VFSEADSNPDHEISIKELLNWVVHCDEVIHVLKEHEPHSIFSEDPGVFENLNVIA
jgi:hypothetical protein